jgi:hypothetical protein
VFTPFTPVVPALWQPDPVRPGVYILDESATYLAGLSEDVVWVKQDGVRESPLARVSSPGAAAQTPGSWHWSPTTGLLYLHPRPGPGGAPIDPRVATPFEVIRPTDSGVFIRGHGSRVENIVAEGWGLSPSVSATQKSGIHVGASGQDHVAVVNCESYYNPSHAIAHWAHSGDAGVVTFVGCRAGLCNFNASSETIYNTYAPDGGQSIIFDSCEAAYGTLPSDDWDYSTSRRGRGFYGHTSWWTIPMGPIIMKDCVTRGDNPAGCSNPSGFTSAPVAAGIEGVRCWIVGELFLGGPGCDGLNIGGGGTARINGRYLGIQASPGVWGSLHGGPLEGWAVNCVFELDARARTGRFAFGNSAPGGPLSSVKLWNCTFLIRTSINGMAFSFEYDQPTGATGAELRNCVVMHEGPGQCVIGLGNPGAVLGANAYHGVDAASYAQDAHKITLAAPVPLLAPPPAGSPIMLTRRPEASPLLPTFSFDTTGRWLRRTDRGAVNWATIFGDLNADGTLDVDDLHRWHESPADLTGDGVANGNDRAWLELALRFDEGQDLRAGRRPRP